MSDLRENLKTEFQEAEYRYGYAESFLNTRLATQIRTLREQREKTQAAAAALMGIKQPGYRRFEDVNHSVWKTDSLWNIARAYGVRLDISFKTFGSLLDDKEHFNKESLKLPAFEEDPAFKEPPVAVPEPQEANATMQGLAPIFSWTASDSAYFARIRSQADEALREAIIAVNRYAQPGSRGLLSLAGIAKPNIPEQKSAGDTKGIHLVIDNDARLQRAAVPNPSPLKPSSTRLLRNADRPLLKPA